jgi:hypothetical protein
MAAGLIILTILSTAQSKLIKEATEHIQYLSKQIEELEEENLNAAKRENYLLNILNDSMDVLEPKRFILHRMAKAPFSPVDYKKKVNT